MIDPNTFNRAGCIVFNRVGEVLLIEQHARQENEAAMSLFPKGHIESGETPEQAAAREAEEEGGVAVRDLVFIGSTAHDVWGVKEGGKAENDDDWIITEHVVTAWYSAVGVKRTRDGDRPNRWVSAEVAREILTYNAHVQLLDNALGYVSEEEGE